MSKNTIREALKEPWKFSYATEDAAIHIELSTLKKVDVSIHSPNGVICFEPDEFKEFIQLCQEIAKEL